MILTTAESDKSAHAMKKIAVITLVASALASCRTAKPPFKSLAAECADRADRHGAKVKEALDGQDVRVLWTNHYNRTEGRCYMLINFFDNKRRDQPQSPASFFQLHDPIEAQMLAGYTTWAIGERGRGVYCFVIGKTPSQLESVESTCANAQTFVTDRMTK